jgi:hypothetical protein
MNRRRNNNTLPMAAATKVLIGILFFGIVALRHVSMKNQLHEGGREIKELERELAELRTSNQVLRSRYARLSSRSELERRLQAGEIDMAPIAGDRIVRVAPRAGDVIESVQPVSNRITEE